MAFRAPDRAVTIRHGEADEVAEHGPFDLLVIDPGGHEEGPLHRAVLDPAAVLCSGGVLFEDDLWSLSASGSRSSCRTP